MNACSTHEKRRWQESGDGSHRHSVCASTWPLIICVTCLRFAFASVFISAYEPPMIPYYILSLFPASVARYLYTCMHVLTEQVVYNVYVCAAAIGAFKSFTRDFVHLCKRVCEFNILPLIIFNDY